MKHPRTIEKYNGTLPELGKDINNLHYDALVELFEVLRDGFKEDSKNDAILKHPKVAKNLENMSKYFRKMLEKDTKPMADLCRKYNDKPKLA